MKNLLAYTAGYIDGDGCFFLKKEPNPIKYRAQIIVSSTNKPVLQMFKYRFGGSIYKTLTQKSHWKQSYHWIIRGKFALEFSKHLLEFLVEKKGDALIFNEFVQNSSKEHKQEFMNIMKHHRDEIREINESVVSEIRSIKRTGISKEVDFAYLAGFIDAECCLGISKYKPKNRPNNTYKISLQCNNANPKIFYWLMKKLGGSISHVKRNHKNPKHRDQITWVLTGNPLAKILPKILPHLRNKKSVCEKLIEFYNTILPNGGDRHSEEFKNSYDAVISIREKIVAEIHKLNSKGITNV